MKELMNVLRQCFELALKIDKNQKLEFKNELTRNELRYNKQIFLVQLEYLGELIQRELRKKG